MRAPSSVPSRASSTVDTGSRNSGRGSIAWNATPPASTSSAAARPARLARDHFRPASGGACMDAGVVHGLGHHAGQVVAPAVGGVDARLEADRRSGGQVEELHHPVVPDVHVVRARGGLVAQLLDGAAGIALPAPVAGIVQAL